MPFSPQARVPCSCSEFAVCLGHREVTAIYYAGDNVKPEARLWPSFEDSMHKYRASFDETDPLARLYLTLRGISVPILRSTTFSSISIPFLLGHQLYLFVGIYYKYYNKSPFWVFTLTSPNWKREWTKLLIQNFTEFY